MPDEQQRVHEEHGRERAGHLHRARGGAHEQKRLRVEPGRGILDGHRPRAVEAHGIERVATDARTLDDASL